MGILHIWTIHIGIFPMWFFPVRQTCLWRLVNVKFRGDKPALAVSSSVTNKIAVFLELFECRENGVGTFLANSSQPTGGELPAIIERQHF